MVGRSGAALRVDLSSGFDGGVAVDLLNVLDLRIDATQVFRQGIDTVDDKCLGVASGAVFVVDSKLVVGCHKRIES